MTLSKTHDVDALTDAQVDAYARQYAEDYDPVAAYVRTFGTDYLDEVKRRAGALMTNERVRRYIAHYTRDRLQLQHVTRNRTLLELGRIAFVDPRRLVREDGTVKAMHEIDEDTARTIAGVESSMFGTKLKIASKVDALKTLAKIQGLIVHRAEVHAHVEVSGRDVEYTDSELALLDDAIPMSDDDED